jgi:probable DNA repair protein
MHEEIFHAVELGATVLTAGRRLARVLSREFHSLQAARGRAVWNRPDILPLEAYLDRAWSEWLGRYAGDNAPILLDALQERVLWEQIIRESPAGESLLQIPETARQAMETSRIVAEYRLPVDGSFEASEDWAAFAGWWREFRRRCSAHGWLERARLGDFLRDKMAGAEVARPAEVFIAGFAEMTPLQTEFMDALGEWRAVPAANFSPVPERRKFRDSACEIRSAAEWARRLLENDPATQIGATQIGATQIGIVVAPDLARIRGKVERIFGEILEPGWDAFDGERAFHLSVGPALAQYPVVSAALLMLEFALGKLPLPRVGMLLRSPFVGGAESEWGKRAQLDAKLRRNGWWDVSLPALRGEVGSCPALRRVLRRVEKALRKIPREQLPSQWAGSIQDLLDAFGWPGDRAPSSREFQTIAAWRGLLSKLASLDLASPPVNLAQIAGRLHELTAATRFQVEDEGAPVQVMGMLEAAGLRFDHLWIMGLHDEALPASAHPNPFLPTALQRRRRLPHSTPERELEFANKLMEGLLASAPDVVISYPATDGDRMLAPSPLAAPTNRDPTNRDPTSRDPTSRDREGAVWLEVNAPPRPDWIVRMRGAASFDEIAGETGPALADTTAPGGATLFKDMAACPFRAFAKHRLGARPLEETDLGLSYRDRGISVHKALEAIWLELGSHARLMALDPGELRALIARGAAAAVAKLGPGIGRDLEKQRLQRLLSAWLEIEKSRAEFTVAGIEAERAIEISGLQVRVRADRVDVLPDGREIILDYKTGQLKTRGWEGERPDEPQLPLYCATGDRAVAGAAFAMIRTGELCFRGLTANGDSLPALKQMPIVPSLPFDQQLHAWRRVLGELAADFRAGKAEVDPKQEDTCKNCGLRGLCRIRELENVRG